LRKFVTMKYLAYLLTLLVIGCSGSTKNWKSADEKAAYYTVVQFFDGHSNKTVYAGEISHVLYGSIGGTIVLNNGRAYVFESWGARPERSRADQENNYQQYMHQLEAYARQRNPEYNSGLQPN
jgi:hypothetical protein